MRHKTSHPGKYKKTTRSDTQEQAGNLKPEPNKQRAGPRNTPPRQALAAEEQDLREPDTLERLIEQMADTAEEGEKAQLTAFNKEEKSDRDKIQGSR